MIDHPKTLAIAIGSSVATALLVTALTAYADGNPSTDQVPKLIPYQGTLEKDGTGVTGQVPMTFSLFDGSAATTAAWTEKQTVNVFAGRFLAMLGATSATSATNLAKTLTNADDVYLAVTLNTGSGDVPLSNRQRFLPTPYSLWTTASTNFKTNSVDAPSGVPLTLNAGTKTEVQVGGNLRLRGYDVTFSPLDAGPRGDGGRAVVQDTGDTLALNFNGDFAGGVRVDGAVNVPGNLTVGTSLSVNVTAKQCSGGAWDCVCPTGRHAISGGFICAAGSTGVMSYPTPNPQSGTGDWTGWHATCQNTSGTEVKPSSVWVMCSRIQ